MHYYLEWWSREGVPSYSGALFQGFLPIKGDTVMRIEQGLIFPLKGKDHEGLAFEK
jgi:hypothetical protein